MATVCYEGTLDEIVAVHGTALANRKVTLTVEEEKEPAIGYDLIFAPNLKALAIMHEIEDIQNGMRITSDGSDTKQLLREARGGAMYGYQPTD